MEKVAVWLRDTNITYSKVTLLQQIFQNDFDY